MAKSKEKAEHKEADHTTASGVQIQGNIVQGEKSRLTPKEQGQLARGEINEKLEPVDKPVETDAVVKTNQTLYHGQISAEAIAAATGEEVSMRWVQEEPTTEDGLFYSFCAYHPSAIRNTFEVDASNSIDPTKRTYLEK